MLETLHEDRFADLPVPQVHATLLAEGVHLCSSRTMYRILDAVGENVDRRVAAATTTGSHQGAQGSHAVQAQVSGRERDGVVHRIGGK